MENLRRLGPGGAPGFAIAGFAIALWGALALSTPALATTIDLDFEEPSVGPGGAQEVIAAQYNPDPATGVQITFFSPAGNPGGSSLAEVHQSDDFGADNQVLRPIPQGGDGTGWIGIFFSAAPASSVEMTAFDVGEDGLILEAYGAIDATDLLGSFIIDGTGRGFGDGEEDLMTLNGIGAIRSIVLKQVRDDPTRDGWVVDDMQFIFTPEPATAWLMGLGIFALGFARRRR